MINRIFSVQFAKIFIGCCLVMACSNEQQKGIANSDNTQVDENKDNELELEPIDNSDKPRIVFFGNSLSAGYGLEDPENQSFPGIIRKKLKSAHLEFAVINAGLSGETTAGGKNRIDWILKQPVSIFILELGGNDGLRGIPTEETRKNLQAIIDAVKANYPEAKIVLAGMEAPPNMGDDYTSAFREIYPALAEKNKIALIPFLLQNVGGEVDLNQSDGIHPNVEGAKIVAENVWSILKPIVTTKAEG